MQTRLETHSMCSSHPPILASTPGQLAAVCHTYSLEHHFPLTTGVMYVTCELSYKFHYIYIYIYLSVDVVLLLVDAALLSLVNITLIYKAYSYGPGFSARFLTFSANSSFIWLAKILTSASLMPWDNSLHRIAHSVMCSLKSAPRTWTLAHNCL